MLVLIMLIPASAINVFADDDAAPLEVEWWNFRNSDTNNGITDRPTPCSSTETWQKWAMKFGTGYAASPTPPIIVDGKLYIGMSKYILELDKETGEELRRSGEMAANVGYAMNPPVYADGKIFIQIGNGMICAVDRETMQIAWTTPKIGGQTVSPLSYVNIDGTGYIYTGTWNAESRDGTFFCVTTDDSKVTDGVKELEWRFVPAGTPDTESISNITQSPKTFDAVIEALVDAEHPEKHRGFYWAGAYANEKYIAIGSDDGTKEGDYTANAVIYTLDPKTGEVIDRVDQIKGDIRSTVVYNNSALYMNTKGGLLIKVPVDEEGDLGNPITLDLEGMSTASPVVYGDKIYMGVSGTSQFSADSGHNFTVVKDHGDSLERLYKLPIKGYPQAAALVSTARTGDDFDGDGEADGRIYIYFTYNMNPGGIYCIYDQPDWTTPSDVSVEQGEIFIPSKDKQQYCLSTICADKNGTLYYKNDSAHLFAVETNLASLLGVEMTTNQNENVEWDNPFEAKIADYNIVVSAEANSVDIKLEMAEGAIATVAGEPYAGSATVELVESTTSIPVVVSKAGQSRTYTFSVRKKGTTANLVYINSNDSNSVPSATGGTQFSPVLNEVDVDYIADWSVKPLASSKTFYNIWLEGELNTTIKVYPVENVMANSYINADGTIKRSSVSGTKGRWAIYFDDKTKPVKVRVEVTSETGTTKKDYYLTLDPMVHVAGVEIEQPSVELEEGETITLNAVITPSNASDKTCTWSSSDEGVATVDANGKVTAVGVGAATITVTTVDGGKTDTCDITVNYTVIEGESASIVEGDSSTVKLIADGPFAEFESFVFNGNVLTRGTDYTVSEGSTIVELSENFVASLTPDSYNYEFVYTNGKALGTLTVLGKPAEETVSVNVIGQAEKNTIARINGKLAVLEGLEVKSSTASAYGFSKSSEYAYKATTLDALVALHAELYGDAFASNPRDYLDVTINEEDGSGTMKKIFGIEGTSIMFHVNDQYPCYEEQPGVGSTISDTPIVTGDRLRFFKVYADDEWGLDEMGNSYLVFDKNEYSIHEGEELEVSLEMKYALAGMDSFGPWDWEPAVAAKVYIKDSQDNVVGSVDSDEDGIAVIKTSDSLREGEYYLVVGEYVDEMFEVGYFSTPYAKLTVTDHKYDAVEFSQVPSFNEGGELVYTCTFDGCKETKTKPVGKYGFTVKVNGVEVEPSSIEVIEDGYDASYENWYQDSEGQWQSSGKVESILPLVNVDLQSCFDTVEITLNDSFSEYQTYIYTKSPGFSGYSDYVDYGFGDQVDQWNKIAAAGKAYEVSVPSEDNVIRVQSAYVDNVSHNLYAIAFVTSEHDWDKGKVTKEPTIGSEGIKTYTCKRNGEHTKTEKIAKVDPKPLTDAIKAAQDTQKDVATSKDGSDIDSSKKWTTASEKKALDDAIATAQKVAKDKNSTQKQVDDAVKKVKDAQSAYDKAKKDGKIVVSEKIWYRLSGEGRYDTMKAIVDEGFTKTGGTVVVTTGEDFKDALSAAGLAGYYKAPIVTTNGKSLSKQAKQVLNRLKPKRVIVLGGPVVVSDKVLGQIQTTTGVTPKRIFGNDSCETSAKAAVALKNKWKDGTAIIATNASFKDALSVAPIAYAKGYPILLTSGNKTITKPVLDALTTIGTKNVIIVGGEGAVGKDVVRQLNKQGIKVKVRLAGNTGVETSAVIAKWGLKNGMTANKMGVASSQTYPDALAGAALCGINKSVLVLADDKALDNGSFPKAYKAQIKKGYVFGGESAVGKKTWTALNNSTK